MAATIVNLTGNNKIKGSVKFSSKKFKINNRSGDDMSRVYVIYIFGRESG